MQDIGPVTTSWSITNKMILDGGGHTITIAGTSLMSVRGTIDNLIVDGWMEGGSPFGVLGGGVLSNVVSNVHLTTYINFPHGPNYSGNPSDVAGIASINGGTIINCVYTGTIIHPLSNSNNDLAGICT